MADNVTMYGDISPRTSAYAWAELLKRAVPGIVTERSAQTKPMKKGAGKVIKFRRYKSLARATTPLAEGVTPTGKKLTYEDVQCILDQYGDFITLTDVIEDTHEDPVFQESNKILSEQIAETREVLNIGVLKSGTSVFYANGSSRSAVNTVFSKGLLKKVVRYLKGQKAKYFTEMLSASPNYGTSPIEAAFIAYGHTDLEADIRGLTGFVPVAEYSNPKSALPYEVGSCENIRFILTTLFEPWADAGGAAATLIGTTNPATAIDVYPLIVVAQDAWATVPLRGGNSGYPVVVNPKPSKSDPLGQRGHVGWKFWHSAVILNETFMCRIETGATLNPT